MGKTERSLAALAAYAVAAAALIALDQWTKALAAARLAGNGIVRLLGDFAVLVYAENRGAFLSLGSGLPPGPRAAVLVVLPIAALALLAWALLSRGIGPERSRGGRVGPAERAAVALIAAGGGGNLIDRLARGQVRDFLLFRVGPVRTGVMNLADLYILAAILVIVAAAFLRARKAEARKGDAPGPREKAREEPPSR